MTTRLPPALEPWRAWLNWFAPELASVIGEYLLRLAPMLTHGNARVQRGEEDPDGIDDLRQRGNYERLLLSEWVLADAMPDEFLRRAANNEHLFLAPKLVTRRTDGLIVAVFDAGPAQWGPARLLHVAMWILLARRAETMRVRFAWGLAHEPGVLHDADSPGMLRQMLRSRTHQIATGMNWQAWRGHFATLTPSAGERWLFSSKPGDEESFSHACAVRRGFDEHLHVAIGAKNARRTLRLALPPAQHAAQVLRGDFLGQANAAAHRKAAGKLSLRQPPLISASGEYVALPMLGESRALLFRIQHSAKEKAAKPRYSQWLSGADLACGAISGRTFGGMVADAHHLHFWKVPGFHPVRRPSSDELTIRPGVARWLPCVWLNNGGKTHRFALLDHAGRLLCWTNSSTAPGRTEAWNPLVEQDVVALVQGDEQRLLYATYRSGQLTVLQMHREGHRGEIARLAMPSRPASTHFSGSFYGAQWHGAVCVEFRPEGKKRAAATCRLHRIRGQARVETHELGIAHDSKLLGVINDPQSSAGCKALTLRADRRALAGTGPDGTETLYQSSSDIMAASVAMNGDLIALVNLDGQLVVLADGGRRLLMCLSSQGDGDE